ncbi:MAG: PriCT-2 domain-containing protein, partial [Bacteroidota bacterium]
FLRQNQYVNNVQQSVELLIEKINVRKVDITADRGRWLALATAMASSFGETGRTYFHAISQYYPGYDRAENDKLFDDVKRRGYNRSIGVFFNACKDYGITFKN